MSRLTKIAPNMFLRHFYFYSYFSGSSPTAVEKRQVHVEASSA